MPHPGDYTFMWWPFGWRGRSPDGRQVLCIRTGRYGLALDVERAHLLHFGLIRNPRTYLDAVGEDNEAVFSLPAAELHLEVVTGTQHYRCVRAATDKQDLLDYPIRIIESGRFFQRVDILQLNFEEAGGRKLAATGRLEICAWPDRVGFLLECTPRESLRNARLQLRVKTPDGMRQSQSEDALTGVWRSGQTRSAGVWLTTGEAAEETSPAEASVRALDPRSPATPLEVTYDPVRGWYRVALPTEDWDMEEDLDRLDRVDLSLSNPVSMDREVRLLFAKDDHFTGITGLTPMLRDGDGYPTGIPVQISKNWHRASGRKLLYQGPWFHGFTVLHLPAHSETRLELGITYARWGGVPAASHAQLCLIGWGTNQLWEEAAIGSFGESICYDPDVNLQRAMIDDVRPLMVWRKDARRQKWSWTNNVGGGDFLVYFDSRGQKQYLSRMRTAYRAYGPNLTDVVYSGQTADGHIAARIEVLSPRSDDTNRALHRFRYDVLKPTPFRRLAFYQVGADHYNDHQFLQMARGNAAGLTEEWRVHPGGQRYDRTGMPCPGEAPWFSLHQAISKDQKGGAWANRGLVIRSWSARLAGKEVSIPYASCYGTDDGVPSMNVELSAPPGVTALQPGDFVEAEVELAVMPMTASDYYGPNANLRAALEAHGNTWLPILREAASNDLGLKALRGSVVRRNPPAVEADAAGTAEIQITGGLAYVPVVFTGLDDYRGYALYRRRGRQRVRVDQTVHGNDYWQADYDAVRRKWSLTFNVPLDTPADRRETVDLELIRIPTGKSTQHGRHPTGALRP